VADLAVAIAVAIAVAFALAECCSAILCPAESYNPHATTQQSLDIPEA